MSEPKITFHAPVPRDPNSVPPNSFLNQDQEKTRSSGASRARLARTDNLSATARSGGTGNAITGHIALHALRRWWKLALPASLLLAAAAVGAIYWTFEPQFEAAALLEMDESAPYIAFEPREGGVSKGYFRTQIEIIKSHWILGRTVAQANVKDLPEIRKQTDPIEWLRKRVTVVSPGDTDIFEIKYSSADPESAALLVNEVTRQYLTAQEEEDSSRFRSILAALDQQMKSRDENVRGLQQQVEAAATKFSLEEPEQGPEQGAAQAEPKPIAKNSLAELQSRLIEMQVDKAMLAARITAMEEEVRATEAAAAAPAKPGEPGQPIKKNKPALTADELEFRNELVERELDASADVKQLDSHLQAQQMSLDRLEKRVKLGKQDSLYKRQQEEIAISEKNLEDLKKRLRPRVEKDVDFMLRTRHGDSAASLAGDGSLLVKRQEELRRLNVELRGCEIAEENLRSAYATELTKALQDRQQLSGEALNLKFKKDELAEAKTVLTKITDRVIALQTERSAPTRIKWHEPARVPQVPIEVLPMRNMSVAGLLTFLLPFALAVAWEVRARRISCPDDLEQRLHLTVLGEIARLPSRPRTDLRSDETRVGSDLRVFEESIDSLRTTLTLSENLRDMRILAITSAANHEGKTSVASQLAMSLARATGKTTLLIDGDMRSPDVHQVFGVAREPGLAEVLSNECSLADAIVPTHNPKVQVLTAGRLKVSPHRLLGNGAWKSLLAQIPDSYGYVIIDTPPVLAASEALVLSKYADAILICVMRDVSRADQVRKASNLLTAAGGCPVGTVLNGVPTRSYKYYYGTYPTPTDSTRA